MDHSTQNQDRLTSLGGTSHIFHRVFALQVEGLKKKKPVIIKKYGSHKRNFIRPK